MRKINSLSKPSCFCLSKVDMRMLIDFFFLFFFYFPSFTLFPLLLLFDASVNCRSSMKTGSKDDSLASSTLGMEHKVSDSVAEGVVLCLEEVLKKCPLGSVDQVLLRGSFYLISMLHCSRFMLHYS